MICLKILKTTDILPGKWLTLKETTFKTKSGYEHTWRFVERTGMPEIVSVIVRSDKTGKILLIRQTRVPIEMDIIEFPAGLVDANESLETAAIREVKEETGYLISINDISPATPKSPGLTNETVHLVQASSSESNSGELKLDETEEITSFWVHPDEFFEWINQEELKDTAVSNDVYAFMLGYKLKKSMN